MNEKEEYLKFHAAMSASHQFKVARNIDGHPGRWVSLDQMRVKEVDHYTIRPNELVFDIDFREWSYTRNVARKIQTGLRDVFGFEPSVYVSGGRGLHLHVRLREQEDLLYMDFVRIAIAERVLKNVNLIGYFGRGRPVDAGPIKFSSLKSGHMIRAPGGKKGSKFKTYIDEVPGIRWGLVSDIALVRYEDWLPVFDYPDMREEFKVGRENFVHDTEPVVQQENGYMVLPCIKRLLKFPVSKGSRNTAAKVLALAAHKDGLKGSSVDRWARMFYLKLEDKRDFNTGEVTAWHEWAQSSNAEWWCEDAQSVRVRTEDGNERACTSNCIYFKKTALGRARNPRARGG